MRMELKWRIALKRNVESKAFRQDATSGPKACLRWKSTTWSMARNSVFSVERGLNCWKSSCEKGKESYQQPPITHTIPLSTKRGIMQPPFPNRIRLGPFQCSKVPRLSQALRVPVQVMLWYLWICDWLFQLRRPTILLGSSTVHRPVCTL